MKKHMVINLLLLLITLLTACSGNNGQMDSDFNKIYYIDSKSSAIVSEDYTITSETTQEMIDELLKMLKEPPKNVVYKNGIPDNVSIKSTSITNEGRLTINFDSNYSSLVGISEVLCRAAIVKTLSQIKDVEYIEFYVNDQPLMDSYGVVVGLMTTEDFIESIESNTNYQASLYFANRKGDGLIEYSTSINYTGTGSIEELVIKQLINGPTVIGMYATIPEGTTLLNVSTKEGVCSVDFNESFLEKIPDISNEVAIYSIVNTLVELPNRNINKVQFLINGKVVSTYRENLQFDEFFERNLTLIEESK